MLIDEKIQEIQNLTKKKITYAEIANIFGLTRSAVQNWAMRKRELDEYQIKKIDEYFLKQNETLCNSDDAIKIPYWSDLPEELKHKEYSYVLAQRASIEQGWNLKPESLCITVMNGDTMENYWYKIRNNDILIIDTNETQINANGSGVYFATSRNNSMFWIREMQALYNGDIEFHSYAPSGVKTRVLTQQQLQEADFRVIGKVIKNVSFRL